MGSDLRIRRKWTFRAHNHRVVFIKKHQESAEHVWMKAFLWALYLPQYASLAVEIPIGDKYKPDVVALDVDKCPLFWGEAGKVSPVKIKSLVRRYPATHFAIAKWGERLDSHADVVSKARMRSGKHKRPFDLLSFPTDSPARFIQPDGQIDISFDDVRWQRIE